MPDESGNYKVWGMKTFPKMPKIEQENKIKQPTKGGQIT
jgi:hypothetical protein